MKKSGVKVLQEYWDGIRKEHNQEYDIVWIPKKGYYGYPSEPSVCFEKHFLGATVREAKATLRFFAE